MVPLEAVTVRVAGLTMKSFWLLVYTMAKLAAPGPERIAPLHEGASRLSVPAGKVGPMAVTGVTSLQVSPVVSTLV